MLTAIASIFCAATVSVASPLASTNTAARVRVRPRTPIPEVMPVTNTVADLTAVEPAKPIEGKVPDIVSVELAKMTKVTVAAILEAILAKASEADAPAIAAAVYTKLVALLVPDIQPAELVKVQTEWYETFKAVGGSKAYWLLKIAKQKAEKGESLEEIRKAFDETISIWLREEEE